MDTILEIRFWFAGARAVLGDYLSNFDSLMHALVALFIVIDYMTGVLCAIVEWRLSSGVGFRSICQKVFIMTLVGVANVLDINMVCGSCVFRSAVILFYCTNEGISIIDNVARIGLPVQEKLMKVIKQLKNK